MNKTGVVSISIWNTRFYSFVTLIRERRQDRHLTLSPLDSCHSCYFSHVTTELFLASRGISRSPLGARRDLKLLGKLLGIGIKVCDSYGGLLEKRQRSSTLRILNVPTFHVAGTRQACRSAICQHIGALHHDPTTR